MATVTAAAGLPWHELGPGQVVIAGRRTVTEALIEQMVAFGGYVHPLFQDETYVREHSPLPARPLPGSAVLHLLGGLAEQSGVLDATVLALLGFDSVRFRSPAVAGDTLALELAVLGLTPAAKPGRQLLRLRWRGVRDDGDLVVEAIAVMLVATDTTEATEATDTTDAT